MLFIRFGRNRNEDLIMLWLAFADDMKEDNEEMAIEQSVLPLELEKLGEERAREAVEWRAIQKEKERERRRLRDRERRQSMSVEEREKHLERRRRNYQLRRQRAAAAAAANAKQEQVNFTPQIAAEAESSVRSDYSQAPDTAPNEASQVQNNDALLPLNHGIIH